MILNSIDIRLGLQFYFSSTMRPQAKSPTVVKLPIPQNLSKKSHDKSLYLEHQPQDLVKCYKELFELSSLLSMQLFKNVALIEQFMQLPDQQAHNGRKSLNSTQYRSNGSKKNDSEENINQNLDQQILIRAKSLRRRKKYKHSEEQSYVPQIEQYDGSYWAVSQSKNMPKNFRKALFNFISKHENYINSVLQRINVDKQQFAKSVNHYRGRINSIADLRGLWMESENKFAKAYRIISMQYLRKHSLGYIFNSKINKYQKHIKYRQIIMQGVRNPEEFTCMKQF